jgi:hypothetical protein
MWALQKESNQQFCFGERIIFVPERGYLPCFMTTTCYFTYSAAPAQATFAFYILRFSSGNEFNVIL